MERSFRASSPSWADSVGRDRYPTGELDERLFGK